VIFLHGLKKRRLGARAGAVDFVGHQQLAEDRSLDEAEGATAALILVHDFGAENIGGHQVGRKLNAVGIEPQHRAERGDELGLCQTRHADQQRVAAGQNGEKRVLHHFFLTENDLGDFAANGGNIGQRLFRSGDDRLFVEGFGGVHHAHMALLKTPPQRS